MDTVIETIGITRSFGSGNLEVTVLKGIDLHIKAGEFVALMGKSGAGKSTLMYQVSLLDMPTSGTIKLFDHVVDGFSEDERVVFRRDNLGYIFQDYALVPELSAEENVALPLMMMGYSNEQASTIARQALDALGLGDKYANRPNQLSGGQQQRVSIARATAKQPRLLFADEPTANLDGASSDDVICALKELHDSGQTIMMVTHEYEYTKYCDRVLWMEDGVITEERKPYREGDSKLH